MAVSANCFRRLSNGAERSGINTRGYIDRRPSLIVLGARHNTSRAEIGPRRAPDSNISHNCHRRESAPECHIRGYSSFCREASARA